MYVFYASQDLPRPPTYPNPTTGQRQIMQAVYDKDHFATASILGMLVLDETAMAGQALANDLADVKHQRDQFGLGKYYVRASDQTLWQRGGWVARPRTYTPVPDVQLVPAQSPERNNWDTRLVTALARLQVIRQTAPANLAGLYNYVQDLARIEQEILRFLARYLRPEINPP